MANSQLPIGFTMSISNNEHALKFYSSLDKATQNKIMNYIRNSTTGNEAKEKIENSVNGLANNNLNFLN